MGVGERGLTEPPGARERNSAAWALGQALPSAFEVQALCESHKILLRGPGGHLPPPRSKSPLLGIPRAPSPPASSPIPSNTDVVQNAMLGAGDSCEQATSWFCPHGPTLEGSEWEESAMAHDPAQVGGGCWCESEKPTLLKTERKEGQPGEDGKQQRKQ